MSERVTFGAALANVASANGPPASTGRARRRLPRLGPRQPPADRLFRWRRPAALSEAARRDRPPIRMAMPRVLPPRQPFSLGCRDAEAKHLSRHAASEQPVRGVVQPPTCARWSPLPGPVSFEAARDGLASARAVTLRRAEPSPRRALPERRRLAVEQLSRDRGYGALAALPHHPHDPRSVRKGPREGTPRIRAIRERGLAR